MLKFSLDIIIYNSHHNTRSTFMIMKQISCKQLSLLLFMVSFFYLAFSIEIIVDRLITYYLNNTLIIQVCNNTFFKFFERKQNLIENVSSHTNLYENSKMFDNTNNIKISEPKILFQYFADTHKRGTKGGYQQTSSLQF